MLQKNSTPYKVLIIQNTVSRTTQTNPDLPTSASMKSARSARHSFDRLAIMLLTVMLLVVQPFVFASHTTGTDNDADGFNDSVESCSGTFVNLSSTGTCTTAFNCTAQGTCSSPQDFDGDGLLDGAETNTGTLLNATHVGTHPINPDTDGDGLMDGLEVNTLGTSPHLADTDGDGINDGVEDANQNGIVDASETSPLLIDTDGDGLNDGVEDANQNGIVDAGETDPRLADSDGDGIGDGVEDANQNGVVDAGETSPTNSDTDGDLINDGVEDANQNGVVDAGETNPLNVDSDGDGINDGVEDANQNGTVDTGETNPLLVDSDDDGLDDGVEDANQNGVVDAGETDPRLADTDSDGTNDGSDNCPLISNPDQADFDGDGIGNACDPNVDTTGVTPNNVSDACPGADNDAECGIAMCFPTFTGVPGNQNAPVIDGNVNTKPSTTTELIDSGWKGAQLYTFDNGTDMKDVAFQAIKDPSHLYFSFEVATDSSFDNDDLIVLTFRPNSTTYTITDTAPTYDTTANDDMRIIIYPLCSTGADGNGTGTGAADGCTTTSGTTIGSLDEVKEDKLPRRVDVWKNSANNWSAPAITTSLPAGVIDAKVRSHLDGTDRFWSVELKLPIAATGSGASDWPGLADDFLMYFNIITPLSPTTAAEFMWPGFGNNANHAIYGNVNDYAFPNYEWGTAHRTDLSSCQGVSVTSFNGDTGLRDIGTKTNADAVNPNPDNTLGNGDIVYSAGFDPMNPADPGYTNTKNNRFYARVTNTGPVAPNVTARFRIADWGYNGGWVNATWRDIPGANPTAGMPVPSTGEEFTLDWIVAVPDIPKYLDPPTSSNSAHQCLLVELNSTANVNFIKKSDYRNMKFNAVASVFEQEAVLSAKGYGAPPKGMAKHEFILRVNSKMLPTKKHAHGIPYGNIGGRLMSVSNDDGKRKTEDKKKDCDEKSVYRWASTGYHNSGRDVIVNGNKYNVLTPAGGFGYYISHTGCAEVENWNPTFTGVGGKILERLANGTYRVKLDKDEVIKVKTRFEPVEKDSPFIAFLKHYWWLLLLLLAIVIAWWIYKNKS